MMNELINICPNFKIVSTTEVVSRPSKVIWDKDTKHYKVVVSCNRKQFTFYYSAGKDVEVVFTIEMILNAMKDSAFEADKDTNHFLANGCETLGEALDALNGCRNIRDNLTRLLGKETYNKFMEC
jgi:hypothetical protein